MTFLLYGPLRTISKRLNKVIKNSKPAARELKYSIQISTYSLCPQKG